MRVLAAIAVEELKTISDSFENTTSDGTLNREKLIETEALYYKYRSSPRSWLVAFRAKYGIGDETLQELLSEVILENYFLSTRRRDPRYSLRSLLRGHLKPCSCGAGFRE